MEVLSLLAWPLHWLFKF